MMLSALFNTFFPRICAGCDQVLLRDEKVICADCLHRLPVIDQQEAAERLIKTHFYGRLEITHAASLLYYRKKGAAQHLIHQLKYHGNEAVSGFLGRWLAAKLAASSTWGNSIDSVVPVPLHKKRLRKRGYNQVEGFGQALARGFNCTYDDSSLKKVVNSRTQVFKSRLARTELKSENFKLMSTANIEGNHILLVDDIITTGATLETCAKNLLEGRPKKISIATMAITTND